MYRLAQHCVYDSSQQSTFALRGISVIVQSDEWLQAYNLEAYFGNTGPKRPDHLLVGRVGEGPWVVVLLESKSRTGWSHALEKFKDACPALGKGGEEGGEEHHRECAPFLPLGRDHRVVAVVVGQVGSEYRKFITPEGGGGRKRREKIIPSWRGKEIVVTPPIWGKKFGSLREFWIHLGVLGRGQA